MEQKIIHITEIDKLVINLALLAYIEQLKNEPNEQAEILTKNSAAVLDKLN
jgi:hypothetical protein